jgi:hypothetical protein
MQSAVVGESFLRETLLSSQIPQPLSKGQKNLLHLGESGDTIPNRLQTYRRQTISKYTSIGVSGSLRTARLNVTGTLEDIEKYGAVRR